ncbi:MAG: hypothetical protein D3906_11035 [Candidatus Electrothrix sp. AUS1_2]|nr:hypothetical protein [Candidatus Electrothrix sp. AUS1_2]
MNQGKVNRNQSNSNWNYIDSSVHHPHSGVFCAGEKRTTLENSCIFYCVTPAAEFISAAAR